MLKFIEDNKNCSEKYCFSLYHRLYDRSIRPKVENALLAQIPTTIEDELTLFHTDYFSLAMGPATDYIFRELRTESVRFEEDPSLIPGPVQSLKVVGADSDRVKLKWDRPEVNAAAVEKYVVMIKSKGKDWEEVGIRNGRSTLVTGLQSSTWYCFMVLARNSKYTGKQVLLVKVRTGMSDNDHKALRTTAMATSPISLPCMAAYVGIHTISEGIEQKSSSLMKQGATMLCSSLVLPLSGAIPVAGQYFSYNYYNIISQGLKADVDSSDTEVLQWKSKTESSQTYSDAVEQSDSSQPLISVEGNSEAESFAANQINSEEVSAYSECLDDNVCVEEVIYVDNTAVLYESCDETD